MFLHKTIFQIYIPNYIINLWKNCETFGYCDETLPNLWTTDADIIKPVFVKDFDHFVNRKVQLLI